ncbi:MAG: hypothetical protein RL385_235 [Pseudomonadota bacterium]|jgi:DNA-binding NarL/FixJ family response regulator
MVRVLIVDDHVLFRAGLVALLRGHPEVAVVADAGSGEAALTLAARHTPEVVLMDMRMPGMDGPACTRELLARFPGMRVLALTTFDDDETVFAALRAGALGYLLKDMAPTLLVEAISRAARGESVVEPQVLSKVLGEFQRMSKPEHVPRAHGLSEREVAVLRVLTQGKSNKEIAQALHISEGTVKNHVTNVFEKLGVQDRTSAALRGRDLDLGS